MLHWTLARFDRCARPERPPHRISRHSNTRLLDEFARRSRKPNLLVIVASKLTPAVCPVQGANASSRGAPPRSSSRSAFADVHPSEQESSFMVRQLGAGQWNLNNTPGKKSPAIDCKAAILSWSLARSLSSFF